MRAIASNFGGRLSLRLRLTLMYGVCFLVAGTALLAITYGLFAHSQDTVRGVETQSPVILPGVSGVVVRSPELRGAIQTRLLNPELIRVAPQYRTLPGAEPFRRPGIATVRTTRLAVAVARVSRSDQISAERQVSAVVRRANLIIKTQHSNSMSSLLLWSAVALGVMALLSVVLGFLIASRALAPLRTMNQRARAITADSLDQRLGLDARNDELGELAATFDALLGRLESSFAAQRRFVANASHELRTPLTLERALVEVALADPDPSVDSLRGVCERVLAASESQEHLIEALLDLARGQAGVTGTDRCDLDQLTDGLVVDREPRTATLDVDCGFEPAVVVADRRLLERLIANLLDNAIVHNQPDGWLTVATGYDDENRPFLRVSNGGAPITPSQLATLTEPFRRLSGERTGDGLGLGLSIANAIATAHGAELSLSAVPGGGLTVMVSFQPVASIVRPEHQSLRPDAFAVLRARF